MPAEKGVRDGHTDALSGTAVLGGEGHFSLLDTVGDRGEGRSSIGGLLDRGTREKTGKEREKQTIVRRIRERPSRLLPNVPDILERDGFLAQVRDHRYLPTATWMGGGPPSLPHNGVKAHFHTNSSTGSSEVQGGRI